MDYAPLLHEVREIVDQLRELHKSRGEEPDADAIVAALIHGGRVPPLMVWDALREHWPEAAATVCIPEIDKARRHVLGLNSRTVAINAIERAKSDARNDVDMDADELDEFIAAADGLIDEWDSVKMPSQVPEPRRDAALKRLQQAGINTGT